MEVLRLSGISVQLPMAKVTLMVWVGNAIKEYIKTFACTIDPQNSVEFAEYTIDVSLGITILHCLKDDVEDARKALDKTWE